MYVYTNIPTDDHKQDQPESEKIEFACYSIFGKMAQMESQMESHVYMRWKNRLITLFIG